MHLVATFPSTQAALGAEQALAGKVPVELIPVPRRIHSQCGFCLLVGPLASEGTAIAALRDQGADGLWRVIESISPGSGRKEKRYEPCP
ncbi:MAG TPA: DUF3343 domain-containing protein [Holophaga sp.]|nr:DUF3343 domain-containing protein [Holophaga sp.]